MKFSETHLNKIFFYGSATLWTWLVFVFLVTGNTFYEVSDNLQIEWLISGVYGKPIYQFPRFFQLYGSFLHFLYTLFPDFSWVGFLFIILNYISGLCLLWCLVEKTKNYHFRIRLALLLLIIAFLTDFVLYLDFTRSALLTGMAGVILFFCSEKYASKALALVLIVAAIGLRFMAIYFIGFISVVWLYYELRLNRMLIAYFAVLFFSFLSFSITNSKFSRFVELNKAKTLFNDYEVKRTVDENCFGPWFFLDENNNETLILKASQADKFFSFSTKKLLGALKEAKGEIQWVLLLILAALITRHYKVLLLCFISFLALVVLFKFSTKVWVVLSLFFVFVTLFHTKKRSQTNFFSIKWLISLMLLLLIVCVKTGKRIDLARKTNEEHKLYIQQLDKLSGTKTLYLINPYDFKRYVNPFSLKPVRLNKVISLTGWHTIHPEYKNLINQSLQLNNEFTSRNVAEKLRSNYLIVSETQITELISCVNSRLNLNITFVNQQQLTDTAKEKERLTLFYVH